MADYHCVGTCGPGDGCAGRYCTGTPLPNHRRPISPTARCGQCGWACGYLTYPHPATDGRAEPGIPPDWHGERPGGDAQ